ncbi:hypothetical protein NMG60_11037484 [Bertholletia excelsa]
MKYRAQNFSCVFTPQIRGHIWHKIQNAQAPHFDGRDSQLSVISTQLESKLYGFIFLLLHGIFGKSPYRLGAVPQMLLSEVVLTFQAEVLKNPQCRRE